LSTNYGRAKPEIQDNPQSAGGHLPRQTDDSLSFAQNMLYGFPSD
jgi:hypothetical protein